MRRNVGAVFVLGAVAAGVRPALLAHHPSVVGRRLADDPQDAAARRGAGEPVMLVHGVQAQAILAEAPEAGASAHIRFFFGFFFFLLCRRNRCCDHLELKESMMDAGVVNKSAHASVKAPRAFC